MTEPLDIVPDNGLSDIANTVLRVLAGQSPDYLIEPGATAFVVEGLTVEETVDALAELGKQGHARIDEVVEMEWVTEPVMVPLVVDDAYVEKSGQPVMVQAKDQHGNECVQVKHVDGEPVSDTVKNEDGSDKVIYEGWIITPEGLETHQATVNRQG